jgi:hypothetical protein
MVNTGLMQTWVGIMHFILTARATAAAARRAMLGGLSAPARSPKARAGYAATASASASRIAAWKAAASSGLVR